MLINNPSRDAMDMKQVTYIGLYFLLGIILFAVGCSSSEKTVSRQTIETPDASPTDTRYTSAFPQRDVSDKINTILRSVKRITITGIYRVYYFEDRPVTLNQIRNSDLSDLATRTISEEKGVAGTAVSIAQNNRHITLLTCAHTVQFPDTLIDYDNSSDQGYIKSVAIKFNQRNLLFGDSSLVPFEIKSVDENYDLALIQINNNEEYSEEFPPLSIRMGDSKDLKWGSMLYIIGYPKGAAVVTRGIVSSPNRTPRGDFLTDALFNHGMSGGIILASNNNYLTFEWVGIANTASAEQENILVPDPQRRTSEQLTEPYKGSIFVEKKTRIVYGLTQSIPTAGINGFLGKNKELLRDTDNELPNF